MIVKEAIDRIQHEYSKGIQSDDSRLNNRLIYSNLLSVRAQIFTEQIQKKQKISEWAYTTIQCIKLVSAAIHDCPCIPSVGCGLWKTENKLPKPLASNTGYMIKYISRVDGLETYDLTSFEKRKYRTGNKYTSTKQEAFIYDDYLFIEIPNSDVTDDKVISIVMASYDPIEAMLFGTYCSTDTCLDYFNVDVRMGQKENTIIEMTSVKLLNKYLQNTDDKRNDAIDERT